MKKRVVLISAFIALTALAIGTLVYAGPGRHAGGDSLGGHGFGFFGHLARIHDELDLSEQQVAQLKAIFAETRQQNAQYRAQLHGGFKDAAEKLIADPNDIAGAQALLDQQAASEAALKSSILQAASKALNVLNADQRAKLAQMLEEHESHWGRRRR